MAVDSCRHAITIIVIVMLPLAWQIHAAPRRTMQPTEWARETRDQSETCIIKLLQLFEMQGIAGHFIKFAYTKSDKCQNV